MVFLFPMAHGSPLSYLDALDAPCFPFGPVFGGHRFDRFAVSRDSRAQRHPKDVRPASTNFGLENVSDFGNSGPIPIGMVCYGQELILQVSRYWPIFRYAMLGS